MSNIRWKLRFENLQKVFAQLEKACAQDEYSDLELAGLVQTYGFTFELSWKTLKDLLTSEGYELNSPRETIRKAFEMSLIDDVERWFNALESRNVLSHIYNESTAKQAETWIKNEFMPMLRKCVVSLQSRAETE
ncbi:MAG: nucleotidyltransferase substrate binding protein [Planctomycetaceae bacterium]|nr:nucleotidyltransferase substrate binding protein [Planctomycetaceae bacterium]